MILSGRTNRSVVSARLSLAFISCRRTSDIAKSGIVKIIAEGGERALSARRSARRKLSLTPFPAAEIKVDTFNFTRYGLPHGRVLSVSQDAITRDKPPEKAGGKPSAGAESASSEPKGQELVYAARVALGQTQMDVDGKRVNLSPGMAVTVEIKTGKRRVIEYLLSPLLRYKQEAPHER